MKTRGSSIKLRSSALALTVFLALGMAAAGGSSGMPGRGILRIPFQGMDAKSMPAVAGQQAPKANLSAMMTLNIFCECIENNHVGKEWSQYFEIDGVRIADGGELTLHIGQTIEIYTEITEYDKYNDVGMCFDAWTITAEDLLNGFAVEQLIEVEENGGRYSGNIAVWTVVYTVSP